MSVIKYDEKSAHRTVTIPLGAGSFTISFTRHEWAHHIEVKVPRALPDRRITISQEDLLEATKLISQPIGDEARVRER